MILVETGAVFVDKASFGRGFVLDMRGLTKDEGGWGLLR